MGRTVCNCCAKYTTCSDGYENSKSERINSLTESLPFCSRQCFTRFRILAMRSLKPVRKEKEKESCGK